MRIIVEEFDDLHREIFARGAEVIIAPADRAYGLREYAVRTPDGRRIMFAEPMAWITDRDANRELS